MDTCGSGSVFAAKGLTYRYGAFCVWEDIGLDLREGEIAFLVGANGSGKSTLLRCLAGWTAPEAGTVMLCGKPFPGFDRSQRARVFFVPDMPTFYDDLTAEEHLEFVLKANRKEDAHEDALRLLADFGLTKKHRGQLPSSYSRGMQEKLALVLALALRPDILLLDEPYGPLDFDASATLSKELQAATGRGASAIISCHHPILGLRPHKVFRLHDEGLDTEEAGALGWVWPSPSEDGDASAADR